MADPRAYLLLEGESVPDGVARAVRGRIDHALDRLDEGEDPDKAVHEARKDMKKVRAALRLIRSDLGKDVYRRENSRYREVARSLSGVRDAKAMVEALDGLELPGAATDPVRTELEGRRAALALDEGAGRADAVELEAGRADVARWPLERDGWEALEGGLRRVYKTGRRRMRAAEDEATTEALHEWRKRAKDLWYHLTLLSQCWPAVLEAEADEAHALSQRLGDDHDLAVLWDFAVEHGVDSQRLREAVERRRAELQREAFAIGRRLYAERPRVFVDRLGSYWAAWRAEPVPA